MSSRQRLAAGEVQFERMDLALAVGAGLDRAGGADRAADPRQRTGPQALADVDRGQAGKGDALGVDDDEVSIAIAVWVDALDVDDPPFGGAATGQFGWAMRSSDPCDGRLLAVLLGGGSLHRLGVPRLAIGRGRAAGAATRDR